MSSTDPVPIPAALAVEIEPFDEATLDQAIDAVWAGTLDAIPPVVGSFEISDDARAEWCMRSLQRYTLDARDVDRQADEWVYRIEQWRTEHKVRLDARIKVFETALERYALWRRLIDDRAATIPLPSGTLKTQKARQASVHIGNDEMFAKWARSHLHPEHLSKVVVDVPRTYVRELRRLPLRIVGDENGEKVVEYSATGEPPWTRVYGVYVEEPRIKPSVAPDLSR